VLGATNREDVLDPALTRSGRLDYVIPFPVSDEQDRMEIFQVHLKDKPLAGDVNLSELVRLTEGMVASQIAFVCRTAALHAIAELIHAPEKSRSEKFSMNAAHFQEAIRTIQEREGRASC
jgi:transitional endoplasmic reticulum ATPase